MKQQLKDEKQKVFIEVEYLEDKKILYSNWIGSYLTVEQVKQGGLLMLTQTQQYNCLLLLNDNRQVEGAWDEANDWIASEWIPQMTQAGLMKMAHILSQDLFAQLSAEFFEDNAKKAENVFQLKMFNNEEDGEKWLLED
ncbi:MAG: hypothetical protein EAZ06_09440 [Cytophagales bacterium]|nr:MAG: hypothetical protein EAY69_03725 [Cytophagales bacterium]TAH28669.1 MAG: hypothetical protein EAZ06_09440 [Cytophagales bacterium]